MLRLKIFVLICLFFFKLILPQTFPHRHFTVKEGLPNTNILSFSQDDRGFIWLSTPNTLSKFDGYNFTNYTISNENKITGNIRNINKKVIYLINNNEIHSFNGYTSDTIYFNEKKENLYDKWLQRHDTLFLFSDVAIYLIHDHKSIYSIRISSSDSTQKILSVFMNKNNMILIGTNNGLFIYNNRSLEKINSDVDYPVYCINEDANGNIWIGSDDKILMIDKDGKINQKIKISIHKKYPIEKLLIDKFSNIWFSLKNYSLFVITNDKLIQIGKNLGFGKTQVNFITTDAGENIWVGTSNKGLYLFHDIYISNYSEDDELSNEFNPDLMLYLNNRLITGTSNVIDLLEKNINRNLNKREHVFIKEIKRGFDNKIFVACSSDKIGLLDIINSHNYVYYFIGASAIFPDKNNLLITGDWQNNLRFYRITNEGFSILKSIHLFGKRERINRIYRDKSDNLWIASVSGLLIISNTYAKNFNDFELLNGSVNDIKIDKDNNIWFTSDKGISKFDGIKWQWFKYYNGVDLRSSINIEFDKQGSMWICNSKGLVRFRDNDVKYWEENSEIMADEIYFLYYDSLKNSMWMVTNEGISKLSIGQFESIKFMPLNINLTKISIDDSVLNNYNNIRLDEDNSIRIDFVSANYQNPDKIQYQYKLEGLEDHWNETENPFVEYASLSPGNYKLLIRSRTINRDWNLPLELSFIIETKFYKTIYFYLSLTFIIILTAIYITENRLKYIKKKHKHSQEIENKISSLKHQALSAMMNPHFIFNSLTSIQYFINNDEVDKANEYLSKFAKLLRLNLESAERGFITIEEELERLKTYLILEKIRFGHLLSYTMKIDREINTEEIHIPNMLIQPFVENAIWHGILPKHSDGEISIKIEKFNKDNLKITITDNGIGYYKGLEMKKSDHISKGMNIIEQKLNLLNESNKKLISVHDISEYEKDKNGTIVEIILTPKLIRTTE